MAEATPAKSSVRAGGSSRWQTLVCGAILIAARLAPLPAADGRIAHLPPVCLFHNLTGLPCPGCGMTRSLVCLAHGRIAESLAYHPLGPLVALCLVAAVFYGVAGWLRPQWQIPYRPLLTKYAVAAGLAITLVAWAARLAGLDPLPI